MNRILRTIERKYGKAFSEMIDNEVFNGAAIRRLSLKDLTHLCIETEKICHSNSLNKEDFKSYFSKLVHEAITKENELAEIRKNNLELETELEKMNELLAQLNAQREELEAEHKLLQLSAALDRSKKRDAGEAAISSDSPSVKKSAMVVDGQDSNEEIGRSVGLRK